MEYFKKYTISAGQAYYKYIASKKEYKKYIGTVDFGNNYKLCDTYEECLKILKEEINQPDCSYFKKTIIDDHSYLIEWPKSKNFRIVTLNIIEIVYPSFI